MFTRISKFTVLFVVVLSLLACTRVEPGYVGIKVNLSGGNKGVDYTPIGTGWAFSGPNTSIYTYPTFVQTAVWTASVNEGNPIDESITFTNKDQMKISADISISYSLRADKVPAFYEKFRSDDLKTFTHGFLHNSTRDVFNEIAGKYGIEDIMGNNGPFLNEVRKMLQEQVTPVGVNIEQLGIIGAPRPPKSVIDAIDLKAQATQKAIQLENEVRQTQAEAAKAVARAEGNAKATIAEAEGIAKANQIKANSITPTLLDWERLGVQRESVSKWNGQLPSTVFGGNTPTILSIPAGGK